MQDNINIEDELLKGKGAETQVEGSGDVEDREGGREGSGQC